MLKVLAEVYETTAKCNNGAIIVSNNVIGSCGGGIFNGGKMQINDATIANNNAANDGTYTGRGGGICNYGYLVIEDATITENSVEDRGGGIHNIGTISLNNSVVSNNSASYSGGGIYNQNTMEINDTTITNNSAVVRWWNK
ncbi:MAG: hypothetical protein M9965_08030 [Anaerolineae bacterium]|nr:hypothetical protein [Anaerolineae bacterium]